MCQIGPCFFDPAEAIKFGRRTSPQVDVLGKDEPDPMATLAAPLQLGKRLLEDSAGLGIDKALQVEWTAGHDRPLIQIEPYFAPTLVVPAALLATRGLPTRRP